MRAGIHEDALQVMIEGGAVREALRTWASLIAVGRFAEAQGIKCFAVEL